MKILFIETRLTGHHIVYLNSLISATKNNSKVYLVVPESDDRLITDIEDIKIINIQLEQRYCYVSWLKEIKKYVNIIKPDVVHFLYGDEFYKFFGIGICSLRENAHVIMTCHQIRRSFLRDISLKLISKSIDKLVVHTEQLAEDLMKMDIKNIVHIEYPQFGFLNFVLQEDALNRLGIRIKNEQVIVALGGTREDKGLDILLKALQKIEQPFQLIIAGKAEDFDENFIQEHVFAYRDRVALFLGFLSDEKYTLCLNAADIVVLPYRKTFDGASGPLGEGVWLKKKIIGSDHGSLGQLIEKNHLGHTFKSEDIDNLTKVLSNALNETWEPDDTYIKYRNSLQTSRFQAEYLKLYQRKWECNEDI